MQKVKQVRTISPERHVLHQVVKYLKLQYPDILFKVDYSADALLTGRQAMEQKRLQKARGWPDLFIAEPRHGHAGLFMELKREDALIFKKSGLFSSEHTHEQGNMMDDLRDRGFFCAFAKGFDNARILIDRYLKP